MHLIFLRYYYAFLGCYNARFIGLSKEVLLKIGNPFGMIRIFTSLFLLLFCVDHFSALAQSGDVKAVTQEEFDKELNESKEEKKQRELKVTKGTAMKHYWNGNFRAALDEFLIRISALAGSKN